MPKGRSKRMGKVRSAPRNLKDTRYGVDERLYHRAGPEKIALELEKAGAKIEQQGDALYLIYPTRNARLCHSYGRPINLTHPWDGVVTQGKYDRSQVKFSCDVCHRPGEAWNAVNNILKWSK